MGEVLLDICRERLSSKTSGGGGHRSFLFLFRHTGLFQLVVSCFFPVLNVLVFFLKNINPVLSPCVIGVFDSFLETGDFNSSNFKPSLSRETEILLRLFIGYLDLSCDLVLDTYLLSNILMLRK